MIIQYDVDVILPDLIAQVLDCDELRQLQGAAIWTDWEHRDLLTKERPVADHILNDDRAAKPEWNDQLRFGDMAPILRREHGRLKAHLVQWGRRDRVSGEWLTEKAGDGLSVARPCLLPASNLYQHCDRSSDLADKLVCYRANSPFIAGMILPATQSDPEAFVILTVRAGELASSCCREPLVIAQKHWADWLNSEKDTRLGHGVSLGPTFTQFGIRERSRVPA